MLKCKHCKTSDLGAVVTEVKKTPIKLVNGEPVGILGEPEIVSQDMEITYCFTCNKPITQDDLYENETCPICGKEVPELVEGACSECTEQKNKLLSMSREELILMMLKQQMAGATPQAAATEEKSKPKVEPKKEEKAKKTESKKNTKKEANDKNSIEQVAPSKENVEMPQTSNDDIINQIDKIDVNTLNLQKEDDFEAPF